MFRQFIEKYKQLWSLVLLCLFPFVTNGATEEVISEKRIEIAMRMIGHEVLMSLGDCESRVMPIEKLDDQYKIPFEREFEFDPDHMISIIGGVMKESGISNHYIVEVEQCETKETVHGFEGGGTSMAPCKGRKLPKDCYSLLITLLDNHSPAINLLTTRSVDPSINKEEFSEKKPQESWFIASSGILLPLFVLLGFIGFFYKKKDPVKTNPNLIMIGASLFDKKNMVLSYKDKKVELSNKEGELLALLHASANAPIQRTIILQRVWGDDGDYVGRTLDVFISKLRKKLEADTSVKIVNIRGIGYKLVTDLTG